MLTRPSPQRAGGAASPALTAATEQACPSQALTLARLPCVRGGVVAWGRTLSDSVCRKGAWTHKPTHAWPL